MPVLRAVPPGRAGALWLRRRLTVATRGAELLQQKLVILAQEAHRLRLLSTTTARAWQAADRYAREALLRAAILGGQQSIEAVITAASADVSVQWSTVMGLRYPTDPEVTAAPPSPGAATPGGMALPAAVTAYREALSAAARHAAAAAALHAVEQEVATTRQRVRALERRWIPRLHAAQAAITLQMAELEDADAVRRRRLTPHRLSQ